MKTLRPQQRAAGSVGLFPTVPNRTRRPPETGSTALPNDWGLLRAAVTRTTDFGRLRDPVTHTTDWGLLRDPAT